MKTVTLRAATDADVDAIVNIVSHAYRGVGAEAGWTTESDLLDGQRTDAQEVRDVLTDPRARLLLAVDEADRVVGCIKLEHDASHAHFGLFAVEPGRQGDGVGSLLLDAVERQSREWGCRWLDMEVLSPRADIKAWYERKGFRPTGETSPFPYGDQRFGLPKRQDLHFDAYRKDL